MKATAINGDGNLVEPGAGSVPILKELEPGRLKVVGTAFYVARYGLFVTAKHVLEELADWKKNEIGTAFLVHLAGPKKLHLRRILRAHLLKTADVAVGQADNYIDQNPENPLMNMIVGLTIRVPAKGSWVATYAYPENEVLDFRSGHIPTIVGNYFEGSFLGTNPGNPLIPYPHFETSIPLRSGASGGPVFDGRGRVIGINSRGWDFRGAEHEQDPLSSIIPITELLPLRLELLQLPRSASERAQTPSVRMNGLFTIGDLARFGHVDLDPTLGWDGFSETTGPV